MSTQDSCGASRRMRVYILSPIYGVRNLHPFPTARYFRPVRLINPALSHFRRTFATTFTMASRLSALLPTILSFVLVYIISPPRNIHALPSPPHGATRFLRLPDTQRLSFNLPSAVKQEEPEPVEPEDPVEPFEPEEPDYEPEPEPEYIPTPRPRPPRRQRQNPRRTREPARPQTPKRNVQPPRSRSPSGPCAIKSGRCEAIGGMRVYGVNTVGGKVGRDWVKNGRQCAFTWRPWSNFGGTVPPRTSHLVYRFRPTITSTFGIALDMGTTHWTEHNDVWLYCTGGFTLRGRTQQQSDTFVKVYHNENGRSMKSWTVDHDRHSIATARWEAGRTYTCIVGARSTKATVYGLALIPCRGWDCRWNSPVWQRGVRACRFSV